MPSKMNYSACNDVNIPYIAYNLYMSFAESLKQK